MSQVQSNQIKTLMERVAALEAEVKRLAEAINRKPGRPRKDSEAQ